MSFHLMAWATNVDVPPREKLVLIMLAEYANESGECFPSQAALAHRTGFSKRTIMRSLSDMEDLGVILRQERRRADGTRTSDTIVLNVLGAPILPRRPGGSLVENARVEFKQQGDNLSPHPDNYANVEVSKVPTGHLQGDNESPARCPVVTAEPVIEPVSEPVTHQPALIAGMSAPSEEPTVDPFDEWWEFYPKKTGKQEARKAYQKALKSATPEELLRGCKAFAVHEKARGTERQYIPYPARWLNRGQWDDEYVLQEAIRLVNGSGAQDRQTQNWDAAFTQWLSNGKGHAEEARRSEGRSQWDMARAWNLKKD